MSSFYLISQLIEHIYSEVEIICKIKNCQCIKKYFINIFFFSIINILIVIYWFIGKLVP